MAAAARADGKRGASPPPVAKAKPPSRKKSKSPARKASPRPAGVTAYNNTACDDMAPPSAERCTLRIVGITGEEFALISDAGMDWRIAQVIEQLPEPFPGNFYQLVDGDTALDSERTLGEQLTIPAAGAAGTTLRLVATVQRLADAAAQEKLDMALIEASGNLNSERVAELVAAGASAAFVHDPPGTWGSCDRKTALHRAIMSCPRDLAGDDTKMQNWTAVVECLLNAKADVNAIRSSSDWRGCGSSSTAFEMILPTAMKDAALLRMFLSAGADANTKSVRNVHSMRTDGSSTHFVLHTAVRARSLDVVQTLLDAGAQVDAVSSERFHNERGFNRHVEETSLHIACQNGDLSTATLLIARGADVNKVRVDLEQEERQLPKKSKSKKCTDDPRDPDFEPTVQCIPVKETPLHIALRGQHAAVVALLVCAGADPHISRVRNHVQTACEELCGDNVQLRYALQATWPSEEARSFFPLEFLGAIEMALSRDLRGASCHTES